MFIGHFGVAMAAKRVAPRPSLGTMILAAQLCDLIWPVLVLMGIEQVAVAPGITAANPLDFVSYPISHSLALDALWAALFALVYAWRTGDRQGAPWLAALVLSHWVLDFISHRPDMPLWPSGAKVGLGLWNSIPATLAVEYGLLLAGALAYAGVTRARNVLGRRLFIALIAFLALLYLGSLRGPPPPDVRTVAYSALAFWVFVAWGYAIDRHRERATPARA